MKIVKIILLLTLISACLIYAVLMNKVSLDSLDVSFALKEDLKITLCNPTYGYIKFQDSMTSEETNILYGHEISLLVKTETEEEKLIKGPLRKNPSHGFVWGTQNLFPKKCITTKIDILPTIPMKRDGEKIKSFKIYLTLYEDNIPSPMDPEPENSKGHLFESQWFYY